MYRITASIMHISVSLAALTGAIWLGLGIIATL